MKKAMFFIYGHFADIESMTRLVDGYIFPMDGYTFGVQKTGKTWTVTEITTGMKVIDVQKRADAVPQMDRRKITNALSNLFYNVKKGDKIDTANAAIIAAYKNLGMKMPVF